MSLPLSSQDLPPAIADYLITLVLRNRALAYIQVTTDGYITGSGGDLGSYGLSNMQLGERISERCCYLEGFFPYLGQHEILPAIQTEEGTTVDIHLLAVKQPTAAETGTHDSGAIWILLIDSSDETKRQQQLQQKANELRLLQQSYDKLTAKYHQITSQPLTSQQGTRHQITNNQQRNNQPAYNPKKHPQKEPPANPDQLTEKPLRLQKIATTITRRIRQKQAMDSLSSNCKRALSQAIMWAKIANNSEILVKSKTFYFF